MANYDFTIVGGGIVGAATAMHLAQRFPGARLLLLEKEDQPCLHQTGRNSGVIHSGIYYKPGSFKARFARAGATSMVAFCKEHGLTHEVCGKVIVATEKAELPLLENLYQRGLQNGLPVKRITAQEVQEHEPHVQCLAGLWVPTTGIVDYRQVTAKYLELFAAQGGTVRYRSEVMHLREQADGYVLETAAGPCETRFVINCAGLHSDRVARLAGVDPGAKIVPFRGEYYELTHARRGLVRGLIYPVPNPEFPFLGVHFTRMIDGSVHAGPNAVLAFKREGYTKTDLSLRDLGETLTFGGFWRMVSKNLGEGMKEMYRSFRKTAFVRSLQRLVPEVRAVDLVPSTAGVRAQALLPDGKLVDDFLIVPGRNALHVCNAPSPAATASLEIGRAIAAQVPEPVSRTTVGASTGDARPVRGKPVDKVGRD
jgi:L-2-hydroxyglutarate oxidase